MMSGVEVIMKFLGMAGLLLLCASLAAGADISGKWTGDVPRRGEATPTTFMFKADGEKLTGTATSSQGEESFTDGKISGNDISFSMEAGGAKVLFKGTVSGTEIKMTRQREGGEARPFTLKRAQ
jgi:hypothetical protein